MDRSRKEIDSLLITTQSIVPENPVPDIEYDVIYATRALKKKLNADGSIEKYKVRHCLWESTKGKI